jgi:two-component system sensor histidine kinase AlgZ
VGLADEIRLAQSYLEIEKLRLGERLRIDWQCPDIPGNALLPFLILQPLLENAIRHGIESAEEGGEIRICMCQRGRRLEIEVRNSLSLCSKSLRVDHSAAVSNIAQRLALYFDAEASVLAAEEADGFLVRLSVPVSRIEICRVDGFQSLT